MSQLKGYVVMEKGFEYNDEINYSAEGGFPKKIYFNIDDVKGEVERLNLEKLKGEDISNYAYNLEDVVKNVEEFEKVLEKINKNHGGKEVSKYSW